MSDARERKARNARKATLLFAAPAVFAFPVLLALSFLVFHLPYLPRSLEDLDSINFALGVRHFDVAQHQPHPPGYPVFILLAKAMHLVVPSELTALALVSVVSGALGVVGIAWLFVALDGRHHDMADEVRQGRERSGRRWVAWLPPTIVAMTAPLYWFTAVRPLSDMAGLAAAVGVQALTLRARTPASFAVAALAAGVASGLRSQVAWLTVPLLIARGLGTGDWGLAFNETGLGARDLGLAVNEKGPGARYSALAVKSREFIPAPSPQPPAPASEQAAPGPEPLAPVRAAAAFVTGVLLWLIPLVVISGGPAAYWHALSNQGAEDLGNITMLWTRHDVRTAIDALYYALVAPWATWPAAIIVLVCAVSGIARLWRRQRIALTLLAAGFGPYFVFDLLFQETFTGRYALPLVVPMAYLAVAGTRWLPKAAAVIVAVAIAMFDAHVGGTSIAAYARQKAPAFRLLDDMAAEPQTVPPALAMDRRNAFDFRRPIVWAGATMARVADTLPSPPQHEWLEAMRFWNRGGRGPVWFVVDPKRTAIDLVQHGGPQQYRWQLPYPVLVSGARPDQMDWYRVERPDWYVGEGWALTPEAAGVAEIDRRGLAYGPIHAGVAAGIVSAGAPIVIGGRSLDPAARPRITASIDGTALLDKTLAPGPFLEFVDGSMLKSPERPDGYRALTIVTSPPAPVAIEQFDVSATRPLLGFGAGWHEQEFNPATGLRWRWLSERGELQLRQASQLRPATLHLEGESPRKYFSRGSRLIVRTKDRVVFDRVLDADFSVDVPITGPADTLVLETDQIYVPSDRSRRTQDRRHLGLRIFRCVVR